MKNDSQGKCFLMTNKGTDIFPKEDIEPVQVNWNVTTYWSHPDPYIPQRHLVRDMFAGSNLSTARRHHVTVLVPESHALPDYPK